MLAKRVGTRAGGGFKIERLRIVYEQPRCHWSPRFLERGQREGWIDVNGDRVTLKGKPDLTYRVVGRPGYYSCHDNRYFGEDAAACRAYTNTIFGGVPSPDPENPSGYRRQNYWACELATTKAKRSS